MKFKLIIGLALVMLMAVSVTGCSCPFSGSSNTAQGSAAANATAQYHKITPQQAKERMDKNPKAIVLDVRTKDEFAEKHIPKAILIPNETISNTPPAQLPDKNAEILVYCRSGNRSKQAADKLVAMGYTNVYDFGGIGSWPYETTKQ